MKHHVPSRYGLRLLLALLALLIAVGSTPFGARAARPAPQAIGPAAQISESEPNNTYPAADQLSFTNSGASKLATAFGAIDSFAAPAGDAGGATGDWYRFVVAGGGATAAISLTGLPADY